jgi:hypothetical protein
VADLDYKIRRKTCLSIDVARLAAGGWLAPGARIGSILLPKYLGLLRFHVPFYVEVQEQGGLMEVHWPREATIKLERVSGGAAGPLWTFSCGGFGGRCGRRARKLWMPGLALERGMTSTPWACRACHHVVR